MIEVREISGTPDKDGWVQIHHFTGLEADKQSQRGEMVLLIALQGASEQTATAFGREVLSRAYEEYYGNLEGMPMERLKQMLMKLRDERPVYLTEEVKLSLSALVLWKKYLYLGICGESTALLVREGKILPLLEGKGKETMVISGFPQSGDLALLATTAFFDQLPEGTIRACLQAGELETAAEVLSPLVQSREDQSKIGVVLIKIGELEPPPAVASEESSRNQIPSPPKKLSLPFRIRHLPRPRLALPFSFPVINLGLGVLLLLILVITIGWGWQRQSRIGREKKLTEFISQAEEKLTAAESIRQLDPQRSLNLTQQAAELLVKASQLEADNSTVKQTKERVDKLILILGGGEKVKPDLFFHLDLLAEGAEGKQLVCLEKEIYVLDPVSKRVFVFTYPDKNSRVLPGGELLSNKKLMVTAGKKFYLLDDQGIVLWDGKEYQERVVSSSWQKPLSFAIWGSNLYVLDVDKNKLLKFASQGRSFSSPQDWFAVLPRFPWEKVKDMAINGHVWILTEDGKVYRFLSGKEDAVNLDTSGLDSGQWLAVATDASRVAVLDAKNKLFVWNKKGEVLFQLNLEMAEVSDMALDPKGRWLFFLTKGEVSWLDLNSFNETLR